jgi:hypothetical protein
MEIDKPDDVEYCRRKAGECRDRAGVATTNQERQQWLELATLWLSRVQPLLTAEAAIGPEATEPDAVEPEAIVIGFRSAARRISS